MSFRKEIKSILKPSKLNLLGKWLSENNFKILYPQRKINSLYLDNKSFSMYKDSIEGCVPRKKIRLRNYNLKPEFKSGNTNLELKVSSVEGRFKKKNIIKILNLKNYKINDKMYGDCYPTICVSYKRKYYISDNFRLTLDTDIEYRNFCYGKISDFNHIEPNYVIEIKFVKQQDDKLLKTFPFHFVRFSKYCQAIESRF